MKILALETSGKSEGVAALEDCNVLAELALARNQRTAQSLAPAMKELLERVGWRPTDVQLVGVSVGPGSFTGLRIGVTAAKTFAYAAEAEVLAVNTLEAVALACASKTGSQPVLHVAIDAQRGEVVAQSFAIHSAERVETLGPRKLLPADRWLGRLTAGSIVAGPALERLIDRLPSGVQAVDRDNWHPRASAVGRLAASDYAAGRRDDLWKLVPHYCRRSAAEEKWEAMGK